MAKIVHLTGNKHANQIAIVSDEDYENVARYPWYALSDGTNIYAVRNAVIKGKHRRFSMHRAIMGNPQFLVDHINGNTLDNRRSNLRLVSHSQNMRNRRRPINNTSGYLGVQKDTASGFWRATITRDSKLVILGTFHDPEKAARVRDQAARKTYGEHARLNFVPRDVSDQPLAIDHASDQVIVDPGPTHQPKRVSKLGPIAASLVRTRIHYTWAGMKRRCLDEKDKSYADYGGRGIKVCERWLSFENFVEDMYPTYARDLTIERVDYDGDYEPANCVWIPKADQGRNTRRVQRITRNGRTQSLADWQRELGFSKSVYYSRRQQGFSQEESIAKALESRLEPITQITFGGVTRTIEEWAHKSSVDVKTIRTRIASGWSEERALTTPKLKMKPNTGLLTHDGKTMSIKQWGEHLGLKPTRISSRLNKGWSVDRALSQLIRDKWKPSEVFTIDGTTQTVAGWVKELGLNSRMTRKRLARGWSAEEAFGLKPRASSR